MTEPIPALDDLTCMLVSTLLPFLVNGTLSEGAVARLSDHVRRCSRCRAEHREWRAIAAAAKTLPVPSAPPQVSEQVWHAIATRPPKEASSRQLLEERIEDALASLSSREREVLRLRFGLEDGRSRTLEEVAQEFGVTRERIRQIEAKALRKLRHPSRAKKRDEHADAGPATADGWVPPSPPASPAAHQPPGMPPLTAGEFQVLCLSHQGRTDREIAAVLGISARTVTTMMTRINNKLRDAGVRRVAEIVDYAMRNGYCRSD